MTPGVYDFVVAGNGFGHTRLKFAVVAGAKLPLRRCRWRPNLASAALGRDGRG